MYNSTYIRHLMAPLFALVLGLASILMLPSSSWALDLASAKASGMVGEKADGYLGAVQGGGEVAALVADINNKRRAAYQAIAARNGTSLQAVEALAGRAAQDKTAAGQYIMNSSGQWIRK
ncbi:YdbL family protein [Mariprofundus erugo]|nr:YdbL family protein [Mariprofundus erugo]